MDSCAVEIQQLTKSFSTPFRGEKLLAVDRVSLRVEKGEVYGLLGPNGSGKSTTMKILLGILRATSGTCQIFGNPSHLAKSRAQVGYVPENPYFYKHLNAEETLRFYGELAGMRGKKLKERIEEMLELVQLTDARKRRVAGYSKGMLQRIGLASALIHQPQILFLDEPTAGVDPVGSRMIRDLILELSQQGITILLSSHLLEQVQEVCDRVGILSYGKLVREGSIEELLSIETQRELVFSGMNEEEFLLLQQEMKNKGADIVHAGYPKTTLERLFVEVATQNEAAAHSQVVQSSEQSSTSASEN